MLILAVVWNGDRISPVNAAGLLICLGGIVCHVTHKISTTQLSGPLRFHDSEPDKFEVSESLMNGTGEGLAVSSDSENEQSDTQVLFDILSRHER